MYRKKRTILVLLMLAVLLTVGVLGYMATLEVGFLDALYMTVITISTVGYTEVAQMTPQAKLFSILIIFCGVGIAGYGLTSVVAVLVEGSIRNYWRTRRMEKKIAKLEGHYILCGAGETGEIVIEEFVKKNIPFIVIENNKTNCEALIQKGLLVIQGDATEENILSTANIEKAAGLVCTMAKDSENVFTVLTARQMNKNLYIISRSVEKHAPEKLKKAGADKTISINEIGGRRIASLITRPTIISFLDVITQMGDIELDLEDVVIQKSSSIEGKTLKEMRIPERIGLIVIAAKKHNSSAIIFNPSSDDCFEVGDTMLVLGTADQVNQLRSIAGDSGLRMPCLFC